MTTAARPVALAAIAALAVALMPEPSARAAAPLFAPSAASLKTLQITDGSADLVRVGGDAWLRVRPESNKPVIVVLAPPAEWDLSQSAGIKVTVRNPNTTTAAVRIIAANADARDLANAVRGGIELLPGEQRELFLKLTRRPQDPGYATFKNFYMYYKNMSVADNTVDPSHIATLSISVGGENLTEGVQLSAIEPAGTGTAESPAFLPFIDAYGQYVHSDWPGKIVTDADFAARVQEEQRERAGLPRPPEWNQYGGWAKGPQLKGTGFFYPAKHDGKWWLVDPDGRLFWSYGPTGVGFGGDVTPITDRQNWFVSLPAEDGPLGQFYKNGRGAMYQYYQNKSWRGLDIQQANLFRKYGPDYEKQTAEISHERLHSWGFNTCGNWSSPKVYLLHKTPYTVALNSPSVSMMRGGDGHSIQDVFDPAWEPGLYATVQKQKDTTAGDPWCLGYFVDNERVFGWRPRAAAVGELVLKAPAKQPSKAILLAALQKKYNTIDALNAAWKTKYASWDAMRDGNEAPVLKDNDNAISDLGDFGMMFAERYFKVCRDAVKSVAPNNMFLGSRFYGHTDPALVSLAAQYWDVISYNIYDNPPDGRVNQYAKIDKPILSTEWGVESDQTQTPFRDAKLTTQMPAARAAKMVSYAEHALHLPNMVGAHFFQYRDQPLSGRPDGEATLRGFVNVADTPNFELVQANRKLAYRMYEIRSGAK